MGKKRVMKIPREAIIPCNNCGKLNKIKLSINDCPQRLECKKCKENITTPHSKCCLVCAFTKKKCPQSLLMEIKLKGLAIR